MTIAQAAKEAIEYMEEIGIMSGQQWYDRFIAEVRKKPLEAFYPRITMEYFARRAAGIEGEDE